MEKMFPNVMRVFEILLVVTATSACIKKPNSVLRFVKNIHRHSISESLLNTLILMYVHRYIKLDHDKIIDFLPVSIHEECS